MKELIAAVNRTTSDAIAHAADIHSRFEQIHPFSDGNGRVGRLLIHAILFQRNFPPAVIRREHKRTYYSTLNNAQRFGDTIGLQEFLADAVFAGWRIIDKR